MPTSSTGMIVREYFSGKAELIDNLTLYFAADGGTGGDITSCLFSMKNLIKHFRASVFDLFVVTQRNRAYKVNTIKAAAMAMASGCQKTRM